MKLLRSLLIAGILSLTSNLYAQITLKIDNLKGGIRNDIDNTQIADNEVEDAQNVLFDTNSTAKKRKGMSKLNSTALGATDNRNIYNQFEYKRSDGSVYHIVHASTTLYYRLSSNNFSSFDTGVSSANVMNFAVFMDTLNYCNGINGIEAWDTSNSWIQTSTYKPRYMISWQNRLCIGGDPAEPANVRFSGFQSPRDWTTNVYLSSSPAVFSINSQDGQNVTGFFLSPNGNLGILKEKSVWEIGGYDKSDFYQRLVIQDIGCSDSGSIAYKDGSVYWLSSEGWIAYNGRSYSIVSDNISSTIDQIQQTNRDSGSFAKNTKTDWEVYLSTKSINATDDGKLEFYPIVSTTTGTGVFVNVLKNNETYYMLHNTASIGKLNIFEYDNLTNLTTNYADTSTDYVFSTIMGEKPYTNTDFLGKYIYFSAYKSNYVKVLQYNQSNHSFTALPLVNHFNSSAPRYTPIALNSSGVPFVIYKIDRLVGSTQTGLDFYISSYTSTSNSWTTTNMTQIYNPTGYTVYDNHYASDNGDFVINRSNNYGTFVFSITYGAYISGTWYNRNELCCGSINTSDSSIISKNITSTNLAFAVPASSMYKSPTIDLDTAGNPYVCYLDATDMYIKLATYSGSWTISNVANLTGYNASNVYLDVFVSSGNTVYITSNYYNGTSYSAKVYVKRASDWDDFAPNGTDSKSYIIAQGSYTPCAAYIQSSTGEKRLILDSTGYYQSNVYDTGITSGSIVSLLADSYTNRENIYHYYRSSDTEAHVLTEPYTSITPNSSVSGSIAKYLQYKIEFSTTTLVDLDAPSYVDSIILNYKSTAGSKRLSSMFYDGRLWNGVSISSTTCLDRTLVLDGNNVWTKFFTTINPMNYINLNGTPYMGSNNGYVYQLDSGESDDGQAIDAYFITKAYSMENLFIEKSMTSLYIAALESGDWNLSMSYYLDKSLTAYETYNIDLDNTDYLINYKIPLVTNKRFYTIQYKFSNSNADQPFDFLNLYSVLEGYPLR
jgi:hypothetical protein